MIKEFKIKVHYWDGLDAINTGLKVSKLPLEKNEYDEYIYDNSMEESIRYHHLIYYEDEMIESEDDEFIIKTIDSVDVGMRTTICGTYETEE